MKVKETTPNSNSMSLEGGKGLVKEKKNGLNILQIGAFFIFLEVLQSVEEW